MLCDVVDDLVFVLYGNYLVWLFIGLGMLIGLWEWVVEVFVLVYVVEFFVIIDG